jgi:hypothetical protein
MSRQGRLLATACLVTALAAFLGSRALFLPAPPFLPRGGRLVALLLSQALNLSAALAMALLVEWGIAFRRRAMGIGMVAAAFVPAGVIAFSSSISFLAVHWLCFGLRWCGANSLGDQAAYALNMATTDVPWFLAVALAFVLLAGWASRPR